MDYVDHDFSGVLDLAIATARSRKTSFENQKLWSCNYFPIFPPSLNFAVLVKYASTEPQRAPFKKMKRIKEFLFHVYVVVKTANVVISRCCFVEDGTELFQTAARATRVYFT